MGPRRADLRAGASELSRLRFLVARATGLAARRPVGRRQRAAIAARRRKEFAKHERDCDVEDEAERIAAWQCIGCGRIEGPQPCVGVCQDRKVTFVSADAYDAALARLARGRSPPRGARKPGATAWRWRRRARRMGEELPRAAGRSASRLREARARGGLGEPRRRAPAQALAAPAIAWASSSLATTQRLRPLRLAQ